MTEASAGSARTPWHLWAVGVIGLFWNGFGCFDYSMTQFRGETYLREFGMTQAQIDYYYAMPTWMHAVWAIGVWGGLAGVVLLLLRRAWALPVLIISLAAYVLSLIYTFGMSNGAEVGADDGWIMHVVILAGCLFFVWYAWAMKNRGVLR
jgi:hypothetical protein